MLVGKSSSLAWTENSAHTGGVLTITDGSVTDKLTLTGVFTTASFAFASDGGDGTAISYTGH